MSTSKRVCPCAADRGSAWWLLCQPSPNATNETQQIIPTVVRRFVAAPSRRTIDRVNDECHVPDRDDAQVLLLNEE